MTTEQPENDDRMNVRLEFHCHRDSGWKPWHWIVSVKRKSTVADLKEHILANEEICGTKEPKLIDYILVEEGNLEYCLANNAILEENEKYHVKIAADKGDQFMSYN